MTSVTVTDVTWGLLVKPPARGPIDGYVVVEAEYLPYDVVQFVEVTTASPTLQRHVVFFAFGQSPTHEQWRIIEARLREDRPDSRFALVHSGEYRSIVASTEDSTDAAELADVAAALAAAHNSGTLDDPGTVTIQLGDRTWLVEPPGEMTILGSYVVEQTQAD